VDQHLWTISGLEVLAPERAKLTILGHAQKYYWAEFVGLDSSYLHWVL